MPMVVLPVQELLLTKLLRAWMVPLVQLLRERKGLHVLLRDQPGWAGKTGMLLLTATTRAILLLPSLTWNDQPAGTG